MTLSSLVTVLVLAGQGSFSGTVLLSNGRAARDAVVYLEGREHAQALRHYIIDQRDKKFIPHVSVVPLNTVIDFPNNDVIFHNVFTEYHLQKFDFGMYPRGAVKHQKFDKAGLAVLLCNIHPDMSAFVMCVDTPYYAKADSKGRFTIDNVPKGTYNLKVWHESGETFSQTINVSSGETRMIKTVR